MGIAETQTKRELVSLWTLIQASVEGSSFFPRHTASRSRPQGTTRVGALVPPRAGSDVQHTFSQLLSCPGVRFLPCCFSIASRFLRLHTQPRAYMHLRASCAFFLCAQIKQPCQENTETQMRPCSRVASCAGKHKLRYKQEPVVRRTDYLRQLLFLCGILYALCKLHY